MPVGGVYPGPMGLASPFSKVPRIAACGNGQVPSQGRYLCSCAIPFEFPAPQERHWLTSSSQNVTLFKSLDCRFHRKQRRTKIVWVCFANFNHSAETSKVGEMGKIFPFRRRGRAPEFLKNLGFCFSWSKNPDWPLRGKGGRRGGKRGPGGRTSSHGLRALISCRAGFIPIGALKGPRSSIFGQRYE